MLRALTYRKVEIESNHLNGLKKDGGRLMHPYYFMDIFTHMISKYYPEQ